MSDVSTSRLTAEVQGTGVPVMLLHGLGGSSNHFQALMPALSGYRCIRPDLPGSGRSKLPYERLTMAFLVRTIIETIGNLAGGPVHLVGHSMGTHVALHVAAQAPELVRSLALFAPIREPAGMARQRLRDRALVARGQGMGPVADAIAATLPQASLANPLLVPLLRESHMRQSPEGFAQSCEALAETSAADLRLVHCPVLLVTGADDGVASPTSTQALCDDIRGATMKVLQPCGHWTPLERPLDCARLLADFLRPLNRDP